MVDSFYLCLTCGNIICKVVDSGVDPSCCGNTMLLLEPQYVDSLKEKHVPDVICSKDGMLNVRIGSLPHPMTNNHHIVFIALERKDGVEIRILDKESQEIPSASFCCDAEDAVGVYCYCNLHGLWYLPLK